MRKCIMVSIKCASRDWQDRWHRRRIFVSLSHGNVGGLAYEGIGVSLRQLGDDVYFTEIYCRSLDNPGKKLHLYLLFCQRKGDNIFQRTLCRLRCQLKEETEKVGEKWLKTWSGYLFCSRSFLIWSYCSLVISPLAYLWPSISSADP